ncbi:MAG: ABC transporter ATP-binding protein/permease [Defluviitaleaceae bacterium]|nr:ABC transporter ATP-binding protein/permease [Defluviitaleaceae bacterium]
MKKYILAHPWLLVFAGLSGGLLQILMIGSHLITGNIVDEMINGDRHNFFSYIWIAVIFVVLIWLCTAFFTRLFYAYTYKSYQTLAKDFFDSVLATKISNFNQDNSAKYISVLNNDINNIATRYFTPVAQLPKDFIAVSFAVIAVTTISPINAGIIVVASAIPLIIPTLFSKKLASTQMEQSAKSMSFTQKVKDYLAGFEVIKTFGVEENIKPHFFNAIKDFMTARYKAGAVTADITSINMAVVKTVTFINYFVAGFFVIQGDISVGEVVAIIAIGGSVLQPITVLSSHMSNIKSTKTIGKRVLDMMNQKDETIRKVKITTIEHGVEFKNVTFSYEDINGKQSVEKSIAIKNVNYKFKKGGKYAIAGESGSGKSTVIKLIMGYYDDYEGDILINSHHIREIDRDSLFSIFSMLHQTVFILDDTLRNNVMLYNNYSSEAYRVAMEKANLTHFEAVLPNGSETILGEGGNTISGGERQRVSIARALLKGSQVLILDEATASLDSIIARDIENAILNIDELTCIFVTHKYSEDTLRKCDGILVMKNGELVEHGTFDELYENKGHFHDLLNPNKVIHS